METSLSSIAAPGSAARLLARKLRTAVKVLRRKGVPTFAEIAWIKISALYLAHRPVAFDGRRRTLMLAAMLNRSSVFSALPIDHADMASVRPELLFPFVRHRFAEVATVGLACETLSIIEIAVVADAMFAAWDFRNLDLALPGWLGIVKGTKVERRICQTARRTALRLGRLDEAATPVSNDREDVASLLLRADVCDALGRMDEASRAYEDAVRRDGADPLARHGHGFHLLKAGRIRDGLASWMLGDVLSGAYPLRRHRPRWGGEPLGPRHLMVLFEHGLGDMIQMARFLPRLLAREPGAKVTARVPAPLAGLMARSFPGLAVVTEDEAEPDYDLFVPSMHLPTVLDAPDLAPRSRYMALGVAAASASARPRIGICWRGHPRQYEATRSIPLSLFARLFSVETADFVVLLNTITGDEAALLDGIGNVETPPIRDFVDLAALVASCDLVVTVDTAVAHLAGAGGRPVLLLSRPDSCWRWGPSGAASPWYDTVEVLRHGGDMDWPGVLAEAEDRIRARCHDTVLVGSGS